jgi:ATP-dependent Clp protease ATP-binding subunit ClpC
MNASYRIPYHDLRRATAARRLPLAIGRTNDMERLDRHLGRSLNSNVALVGERGTGKTALAYGWMRRAAHDPRYEGHALVQFDAAHLSLLDDRALHARITHALAHLPAAVILLDDIGRDIGRDTQTATRVARLYKRLLSRTDVHVIITLTPAEHTLLEREHPAFMHLFETMRLKEQSDFEHVRILGQKLPRLNRKTRRIVPDAVLRATVAAVRRFPVLGALPRAGIALLDDTLAHAASQGERTATTAHVDAIVEAKTGVPAGSHPADTARIKNLASELEARIVGQQAATSRIAATIQRAHLGLRNPNRPLGSFLLLGPSGVGKTETAKTVAELVFGRAESFTRIDMSEFQQEHSVGRLIGAPPGYIGYEEGGALTNALSRNPYSLILLDEIEKAHPKVFDIFLQALDDGRLTSGRNETVDARNAIFMATSNAAVSAILDASAAGADIDDEAFVREHALPALTETFRPEFINRFDAVLVFRPLSVPHLIDIAQLEIRKLESRLSPHRVRFDIDHETLARRIEQLADPRFGARPIKRFVEETCETLLAETLLNA